MNKLVNLEKLNIIDLTHTLTNEIPHWSGNCGFRYKTTLNYDQCQTDTKFCVQSIEMAAGIGTHMDAPAHCMPGAADISSIVLEKLIAPCVVIDVSLKANETYIVTPEDIYHFETNYGVINKNSFVIIRTGWDKFWKDAKKYRNDLIFPTISIDAAKILFDREVVGLGIDTLSPDNEKDGFPIHLLFLSSGKYIIENIANAHLLPALGAYTIALPLKIQGGTESPIRLISVF